MCQQPTSSNTIPINVDNGGYKKKGTKILVLPQHTTVAKQVYKEFCDLMKCKPDNDFVTEMLDSDDATQVNANVKGHMDQLKVMFESDEFHEIEKQVPLMDECFETSDSNSSDPCNAKACKSEKKKKSKLSKGRNSTKCEQLEKKVRPRKSS
jgi:hypothetical protein